MLKKVANKDTQPTVKGRISRNLETFLNSPIKFKDSLNNDNTQKLSRLQLFIRKHSKRNRSRLNTTKTQIRNLPTMAALAS